MKNIERLGERRVQRNTGVRGQDKDQEDVKEATKKAKQEIKKLRLMSPMSAEATVSRNFIDWLVSLPWDFETEEKKDITEAESVLESDHYGLKTVKERIIEYLAVRARGRDERGRYCAS
jgi:ATP-dependent Lon protease